MAPSPRARSLAKPAFTSHFTKLKTSTYTDIPASRAPSTHTIRTLSWNVLGSLIATGAGDRTLRIWNPERTNVKHSTELRGHTGAVERVAFSPISETELCSAGADGTVRFWDVRSKAQTGEVKVGGECFSLSWKLDGGEVVVGRKDDALIRISRETLQPIATHRQSIQTNQTAFSWQGSHIFLTTGEGTVKVLSYPSFTPIHTLHAHTSSCLSLALSPESNYLAIGGSDALISLWETRDWTCVRTLMDMTGPVRSVSWSFDGSYIVGGSDEETGLRVAHAETGEYVWTGETSRPAACVEWHPSRYVLAYSGDTNGLKIIGGIEK